MEGANVYTGNPSLVPAKSFNHDLIVSCYTGEIGLLSVGGFYKTIDDFVWAPYYPLTVPNPITPDTTALQGGWRPVLDFPGANSGAYVSDYVNNIYPAYLAGFEIDWQTRFWYLPFPLNGLVLNVNYTHVTSATKYPKLVAGPVIAPDPTRPRVTVPSYINTATPDMRLINQPSDLANITVGYDYKGFQGRVSLSYIGDMQRSISTSAIELNTVTSQFLRLDVAVKQDLPIDGLQIFLNLNNLNNREDEAINQTISTPVLQQFYGLTADLGIRFAL
jgi:hypothetical protein